MLEGYTITSQLSEMDLKKIHDFLSHSYWSEGIPFATMQRSFENSLCFGLLTDSGEQVGFARVITDYASFAYLADVYISEAHRGKGLSKSLIEHILENPKLQGLRRFMLATSDAHELYKKFGFTPLQQTHLFMEKWVPDIYKKS